jgi:hypothetical protein
VPLCDGPFDLGQVQAWRELAHDVISSSLIDSNVSLKLKQQKNKELGHAPWLTTLGG